MQNMFEKFPAFFGTSKAGGAERLRYRYNLLFAGRTELFRGKRVIDVGSHDGRWGFCALQNGAKFALGIEAWPDTVEAGIRNYQLYGVAPQSYQFLVGDVFETLHKLTQSPEQPRFDLGLCLGFLYHTTRHFEVIDAYWRMGCKHIIVETNVLQDEKDTKVKYRLEDVGPRHNAFVSASHASRTLSAIPSVPAVRLLLESFGYSVTLMQPPPLPPSPGKQEDDALWDFRIGRRVAFLAQLPES
jgi:predicted nicotinamide N-methyase